MLKELTRMLIMQFTCCTTKARSVKTKNIDVDYINNQDKGLGLKTEAKARCSRKLDI